MTSSSKCFGSTATAALFIGIPVFIATPPEKSKIRGRLTITAALWILWLNHRTGKRHSADEGKARAASFRPTTQPGYVAVSDLARGKGRLQFSNAAGEGDISVGTGNFGERYGWYVSAVRSRISANWLLSTISPNILTAPRVYLTFDILRDGTIDNVQITQSSGIAEVDRSALRAVLASNPLGALPPDFSGNKVSVDFYFDFRRR